MKQKKNGFTLLELLVVAGILSIISVVIAQVFFTTMRSNTKSEVLKDVKQNGDYAADVMVRLIQNATSVSATCSEIGEDPTPVSSLVLYDRANNTTTFSCVEDSGIYRVASVSASQTVYLTNSNVTLATSEGVSECSTSTLGFSCRSVGGIPSSILISFRLQQKGTAQSVAEQGSVSFQTSASVRNNY